MPNLDKSWSSQNWGPAKAARYLLILAALLMPYIQDGNPLIGSALIDQPAERAARQVPAEGLAALYPGDEGLERDPRVLFVENLRPAALLRSASAGETYAIPRTWSYPRTSLPIPAGSDRCTSAGEAHPTASKAAGIFIRMSKRWTESMSVSTSNSHRNPVTSITPPRLSPTGIRRRGRKAMPEKNQPATNWSPPTLSRGAIGEKCRRPALGPFTPTGTK